MELLLGVVLFLAQSSFSKAKSLSQPPHIIFIYADDLGWNDVSFHGSPEIPTPNIDALALSGLTLHNYYGELCCTPSRGALMSGKYPMRLGLQHLYLKVAENSGLPLDIITLPQHLKKLGYDTHMIGKWHLGYSVKEYTPTYRGFDSFFGYLNGFIDYYDFTFFESTKVSRNRNFYGIDLYNGTKAVKDFRGQYAPYVFGDQAKNVILNHDTSKPLFMYLSQLAVHSGNPFQPFQAPPEIISKFKYIKDIKRRIHAAVVSTLDDTVGTVFEALYQKDMLKNSIVLFISDNGGETNPAANGASSNFPLRGKKMTYWEGGLRLPAVVWSPLLKLEKPRISNQFMHVTDWLPTFYGAAGGNPDDLGIIDGFDMWNALVHDLPSPRKNLLHNLDPIYGMSSFRMGNLKVVNGTTDEGFDAWYGPTGFENLNQPASMYDWIFKDGSSVRDILMKTGWWITDDPNNVYQRDRVTCIEPPPVHAFYCNPTVKPCLFNITADPCEYFDLADQHPKVVNIMMNVIYEYQKESMPPQTKPNDPLGDPMCHNFTYVTWLDPEHLTACNYAD